MDQNQRYYDQISKEDYRPYYWGRWRRRHLRPPPFWAYRYRYPFMWYYYP